jgi:hypothetical protein
MSLEVNETITNSMIMSTTESRRNPKDLKIDGKVFLGVSSFNI